MAVQGNPQMFTQDQLRQLTAYLQSPANRSMLQQVINPNPTQADSAKANYGLDANSFTSGTTNQTQGVRGLSNAFKQGTSAYENLLNQSTAGAQNAMNTANGLNMQQAGGFTGQGINAQTLTPQTVGQFNYSNTLSPLVQQQMARAQQTAGLQAQNQANAMTQQLNQAGGNNQALAAALRGRTMAQSQLGQNALAPQFLAQQANMDVQKYGQNLQGAAQNNQARQMAATTNLAGQQAMAENVRQNYATNLSGINANNASAVQKSQAVTSAAAPMQNLFGTVGQQLPTYGETYNNKVIDQIGLNPQPQQSGGK